MNKILLQQPLKLKITYQRADGVIKNYKVTPIEVKKDSFNGYVFGEGVRTFKFDKIIDLR